MAIYDVNGNEIAASGGGNVQEESAIVSASGYNTYKSGGATQAVAYKKNLCFAIISDIHGTGDSAKNFVTFVNEHSDYFDFAICLGDNVPISASVDTEWFDTQVYRSAVPFFAVVGNHDVRGATLAIAINKIFGAIKSKGWLTAVDFGDADNGYWYKDFSEYKVRAIALMEFDNTDVLTSGLDNEYRWLDTAQLQWFADTLYGTPSDYSVILFTHQSLNAVEAVVESKFSQASTFNSSATISAMDGNPITDVLNAYITGGAISQTYSPTSAFSSKISKTSTVSKDFSVRGSGSFLCHFAGHSHSSYVLKDNTYNSIKSVLVPSGSQDIYQRQWGDNLFADTASNKTNFYVIGCDTENNAVNIVQIGATINKKMEEKFYEKVSLV